MHGHRGLADGAPRRSVPMEHAYVELDARMIDAFRQHGNPRLGAAKVERGKKPEDADTVHV